MANGTLLESMILMATVKQQNCYFLHRSLIQCDVSAPQDVCVFVVRTSPSFLKKCYQHVLKTKEVLVCYKINKVFYLIRHWLGSKILVNFH